MASSTFKNGQGVMRWDRDDWLSGTVPNLGSTTFYDSTYGKGLLSSVGIDPYRFTGYLVPGPTGTEATNSSVVTTALKNAVAYNNTGYAIGGNLLHSITLPNTLTSPAFYTIPAHGGHNTVVGQDVVVYSHNSGGTLTRSLFFSYNDNTDGDVGCLLAFTLGSVDPDFMTTVPSGASGTGFNNTNPKPMIVGNDGILYIANGSNVASYQGTTGTNGTVNYSALDLPKGYVINGFANLPNYLVIFAYLPSLGSGGAFDRSECTAFFWDMVSSSFTYAYPLPGNYVAGGFSYKSTVGCFVAGRNYYGTVQDCKLLLFNGSEFEPQVSFGVNEAIPEWGGVEVLDDMIIWNSSGTFFQWGSPYIGIERSLNKVSYGAGTTSGGFLKNLTGDGFHASSGTTTSGGLQRFNTNFIANASAHTPLYVPNFSETEKGRIRFVKVFFGATTNGGGHPLTLKIRYNRGSSSTTVFSALDTVSVNETVKKYVVDSSGSPFPVFDAIQLQFEYGSGSVSSDPPFIDAIEVYYENVKI